MNRPAMCSLLMLCFATSGFSDGVVLTGLIDLPGCRMACFRFLPSGAAPVLRPGESAEGITLESLDAPSETVRVLSSSGPVELKLLSFCALPDGVASSPERRAELIQSASVISVSAGDGNPLRLTSPSPVGSGLQRSRGKVGQFVLGLPAAAASPVTADPSASRTLQAPSDQVPASVTQNAPTISSISSQTPAIEDRPLHRPAVPENDPIAVEGEQIKTFYGLEAFLAWDLARGQAALEMK